MPFWQNRGRDTDTQIIIEPDHLERGAGQSIRPNEGSFVGGAKLLYEKFSFQRSAAIAGALLVDEPDGSPGSRVPRALAVVVYRQPRLDISGDTGVQTLIRTLDYVHVPDAHITSPR